MQIDTNIDALQFKPDLPPPYVSNEVLKVEGHLKPIIFNPEHKPRTFKPQTFQP